MHNNLSIVIPCKNEEKSIGLLIHALQESYPEAELIVVNDGSTDKTSEILNTFPHVNIINNPYSKGNGAAVKLGALSATKDTVLFMDADGQHTVQSIKLLLDKYLEGYDMVVGARSDKSQASSARLVGNKIYNRLASLITGHVISDLTSGFRICRRRLFLEFISLLPNGFSYPTTITMAFFRSGYNIAYVPFEAKKRPGKSHLSIVRDGIRFLLIIFKVGSLYSPLKIFAPLSLFFFTSGLGYYLYTFFTASRFTNMGLLLFITSVIIFIFGLISEQITMLTYTQNKRAHDIQNSHNHLSK